MTEVADPGVLEWTGRVRLTLRAALWPGLFTAVLLLGAVAVTWPLAVRMNDAVPSDLGDPVFITWLLRRNWFMLTHDPLHLFDAGIFYPVANTLAMSDLALVQTLIYGFFFTLSGATVASANAVVLVSIVCSGLAMATLAQHWNLNRWSAAATGVAYAFSPVVMAQTGHTQLLVGWWIPLAILSADRLASRHHYRDGVLLALCLWLQFISAVYLAFYAVVAAVVTVGIRLYLSGWKPLRQPRFLLAGAVSAVLAAMLIAPFMIPFQQVSRDWGVSRSLNEAILYSADIKSFLAGDGRNVVPPPLATFRTKDAPNEKALWGGWVVVLLAGFAIQQGRVADRHAHLRRLPIVAGTAIAIAGLVLALGPHLHAFEQDTHLPLPYLALFRFAPGFNSMRVAARFGILMAVGLAILAGCGVQALSWTSKRGIPRKTAPIVAFVTLCLSLVRIPTPVADLAAVESSDLSALLSVKQQGAILWLPLVDSTGELNPGRETARMLLDKGQTPLVGGYSGFFPPPVSEINELFESSPASVVADVLRRLNVRTIILDTGPPAAVSKEKQADWLALASEGKAQLLQKSAEHTVLVLPEEQAVAMQPSWALPSFTAPAGIRTTVGLQFINAETAPWVNRGPYHVTPVHVQWRSPESDHTAFTQGASLVVPMYVLPGNRRTIPVEIAIPSLPTGTYDVRISGEGVEADGQVQVTGGFLADSRTDRAGLQAQLDSVESTMRSVNSTDEQGAETFVVHPAQVTEVSVAVTNIGTARWLGGLQGLPPATNGEVRLGWDWYLGTGPDFSNPLPGRAGRVRMRHDVFPGQSVRLKMTTTAPSEPGTYTLSLGMLSEGVTWFHVFSPVTSAPKRLVVKVSLESAAPVAS